MSLLVIIGHPSVVALSRATFHLAESAKLCNAHKGRCAVLPFHGRFLRASSGCIHHGSRSDGPSDKNQPNETLLPSLSLASIGGDRDRSEQIDIETMSARTAPGNSANRVWALDSDISRGTIGGMAVCGPNTSESERRLAPGPSLPTPVPRPVPLIPLSSFPSSSVSGPPGPSRASTSSSFPARSRTHARM